MKILLDTNIIVHREASRVVNKDIGVLFRWMDRLKAQKCVHPLTIREIRKHQDQDVVKAFETKIQNYNELKTLAQESGQIKSIKKKYDSSENDFNDSDLLNEVFNGRVDLLISEDKKIHTKADEIGIADKVLKIDDYLEKVSKENPALKEYKVLSVRNELFGNINLQDEFFDSFREDYPGFDQWFNKKSDESAYICTSDKGDLHAFLYLKIEDQSEAYPHINPVFGKKKRLKIGTFKVVLNGERLGERFLKIAFDNAMANKVDEIYVTIFDETPEQKRLISLLEEYGFCRWGTNNSTGEEEFVYVRSFTPEIKITDPKKSYPYMSAKQSIFLVPITPDYHTELLPESILNTESPAKYVDNKPHRNAISKVYICRSIDKNINRGDLMIFYRTGGYYKSVVTTLAVVDRVTLDIRSCDEFVSICGNRSIFGADELTKWWNYNPRMRPFVTHFLYTYSFPKRPNMEALIQLGVILDVKSAPRGFTKIELDKFKSILKEAQVDERIIVY